MTGGAAYAYFSSNTVTTRATVQDPSTFTIDLDQTPTGAALYPGGPAQTYGWSIYNDTSAPEMMSSITAAVSTDTAGGVYDTNTDVFNDACLASWFTASISSVGLNLPFMLNGNGGLEGPTAASSPNALIVTMNAGPSVNQDACKGVSPQITMTVS